MSAAELPNAEALKLLAEMAAAAKGVQAQVTPMTTRDPDNLLLADPNIVAVRKLSGGGSDIEFRNLDSLVEPLRARPLRRKGAARAHTLTSFCDLANRHSDPGSAIFCNPDWKKPSLLAVLNYHQPVAPPPPAKEGETAPAFDVEPTLDSTYARHGDHRITYDFPLSEPWCAWVKHALGTGDGGWKKQAEFAAFLEDHLQETASPTEAERNLWERELRGKIATPNELLDLANGLEVYESATYKSREKLSSGESALTFETAHLNSKGEPLVVPSVFVVAVPVFDGGEPVRIPARLRYRAAGGAGVLWGYQLHRPDLAVRERIETDLAQVAQATGLPVYLGAPEGGA